MDINTKILKFSIRLVVQINITHYLTYCLNDFNYVLIVQLKYEYSYTYFPQTY